jgi:hypothetical protein
VRLLYHAKADATGRANQLAITKLRDGAPLGTAALELVPRRNVPGLSDNKLIVHSVAGEATRVWSGSTNFTSAGFYLQTNVGIVLRDGAMARAHAGYFDLLRADPRVKALRQAVGALALRSEMSSDTQLFFSPVAGDALLQAAVRLIRAAQDVVLISCPLGLDQLISEALEQLDGRVLVYGLLNTNQAGDLQVLNRWWSIPGARIRWCCLARRTSAMSRSMRMTLSGDTVAVVTLSAEQVRPIRTNEIAHVRELIAA